MRLPRAVLSVLLGLLWGCSGRDSLPAPGIQEEGGETGGAAGRLVMVGGGLRSENVAVYEAVLEARDGRGPVCVLPTASGTPRGSMMGYVEAFDALGGPGTAEGILLTPDHPEAAHSQEMADRLMGCSGFFFTGGVQSRIIHVLRPGGEATPAFRAIWDRFRSGAVVSGSSAGAAIMSDPMIAGGSSEAALRGGIASGEEGEGVWLTGGLGFLDSGLVDQHFLARGRWARLLVGILGTADDRMGLGIDENTALVVEGDSAWVVGESGVVVMDARSAAKEESGNGGYGVRVHLLGPGDRLDLKTGAASPGSGKVAVPMGDSVFSSADVDLFEPWSLLRVLFELATARDSRLTFHQEGHFLEFRKESRFSVFARASPFNRTPPRGLFLGPFVLSAWKEK